MANYLETYDLAHRDEFRKRVQTAALVVARDVLNEAAPEGDPDKASARYVLARQAARLDNLALDRFAWECALNPTIAAAELQQAGGSADNDLGFVVSSTWDNVAGA